MPTMFSIDTLHVPLLRRRGRQILCIPPQFQLPGKEVVVRRAGNKLLVEPVSTASLSQLLEEWQPLEEYWSEIEELPADPVSL